MCGVTRRTATLIVAAAVALGLVSIYYVASAYAELPEVTGASWLSQEVNQLMEGMPGWQFQCSSEPQWLNMLGVISEKTACLSESELRMYAPCLLSARQTCTVKQRAGRFNSTFLSRSCHKWSEMRFLSNSERRGGFYALVSHPGSGNTWLRLLLEEATGVFTGSVYCDASLLFFGMFGAFVVSDRVLVVKTHHPYLQAAQGAILIVRNPYHSMLSALRYKLTVSHVSTVTFATFTNTEVQRQLSGWNNLLDAWIINSDLPSHIVSYDRLVSNFFQEFGKLLDFLNFPVPEAALQCVLHSGEEMASFKRQQPETQRNPYSAKQMSMIDAAIGKYASLWKKYNIDYKAWKW